MVLLKEVSGNVDKELVQPSAGQGGPKGCEPAPNPTGLKPGDNEGGGEDAAGGDVAAEADAASGSIVGAAKSKSKLAADKAAADKAKADVAKLGCQALDAPTGRSFQRIKRKDAGRSSG